HEKGIQFALDDFGSGYASLNYLRDLPLDLVKIDQQFVQSIVTNQYDTLIVQTIINLSYQLGFKVIAEGIETEEQMRALQALDCDFGQGYYLGRPAPPEQLNDLLQAKQKQI
ncbi:MAG: EAL domain-containing protein, partial [Clostridiaceae bacterium]|nr:EAL domain-containing protein [Clostridiaceae bacterium]